MQGDLTDLNAMHRAIEGCARVYFGMSVSADYLAATVKHRHSAPPNWREQSRAHGSRIELPTVRRASRSRCARAASASG